ncbi:hypothetical protein MPTA5024_27695 [Microbispora sp. ATCC PTA-5024]|nr:hypothetical protein MPTA5024_27695 [Microbispora sp. ATCC PTA-5024]
MGRSTTRAALIYQHTAMAIADALGRLAEEAPKSKIQTHRARNEHRRSRSL